MNKRAKFLFFCMIFVVGGAFCQSTVKKTPVTKNLFYVNQTYLSDKKIAPNNYFIKPGSKLQQQPVINLNPVIRLNPLSCSVISADLHPFVGYNFRISELHAAVGLAQIKKLDTFLAIQKKNHTALKNALATIPEVSFRRVPDENGDSCTFVSWFLPTEEVTKAVVEELKAQNILAGNFYWFVNNWHYISKWDHLKNAVTLNSLHPDLKAAVIHHATKDFSASDAIMSRCISTAIGLSWTDEQLKTKCDQMVSVIKKVLSEQKVAV
jgi:dTDP-4-amino-4,6-dideoxygalactose transaminase